MVLSVGKNQDQKADKLRIISQNSQKLAELCEVLTAEWQARIRIFDRNLKEVSPEYSPPKKILLRKKRALSPILQKIISLFPQEIRRHGNFLNFNGLPFVRFNDNQIWFGVENKRILLTDENWGQFVQFIETIAIYRRHDSSEKYHLFFESLPEAWLEAKLQNDVSKIDGNLILSPLYNQFRSSSEQIDLLALRNNGRLVVIEIKISPNKEHLFQALQYWQEIEKQRVAGNLEGIFGRLKISDEPSLVYLVAPHSAYHFDFEYLARAVSDKIGLYRFDLHENWRREVKILESKNTGIYDK